MNSLEKASLNVIAHEFEKFHFVWTEASDRTQILNLKVLQKRYSAELWSQLYKKNKFKDKYLDFLVNEYLKYFDKKWLSTSCYHNSIETIICRLSNLTFVSLDHVCDDSILKSLAESCPKLAVLDASYSNNVTDNGIMYLCKNTEGKIPCPDLKKLYISSCDKITPESVEYLIQSVASIEIIDYKFIPQILFFLHKEDLPNLENAHRYNLTHLNILQSYREDFTDLLKVCLTVCPKLKSLECCIKNQDQLNEFNNISLKELNLRIMNQTPSIDINTFLIKSGHNLTSLNVSTCIISVNIIAKCCPNLKILYLQGPLVSNDSDASKATFQSLIKCSFSFIEFNDNTNKALSLLLSSSPILENLVCCSCKLSPETEISILKCCNVMMKYITFMNTKVPVTFVKEIVIRYPFLKTLRLVNSFFSFDDKVTLIKFAQSVPCLYFL